LRNRGYKNIISKDIGLRHYDAGFLIAYDQTKGLLNSVTTPTNGDKKSTINYSPLLSRVEPLILICWYRHIMLEYATINKNGSF
jgi:hypothetical protein